MRKMTKRTKLIVGSVAAVALLIATAIACLVAFAGSGDLDPGDGLVTTYTFADDETSEYFNQVKLTVVSAREGYTEDDERPAVSLHYDFKFDARTMFDKSEELSQQPGYPAQNDMTTEEYRDKLIEWFMENLDKPEIFSPVLFEHDFKEQSGGLIYSDESIDGSFDIVTKLGERIGYYYIDNGKFTVYLDPIVFFMDNIDFSVNVPALLDPNALNGDPSEIIVDEDGHLVAEETGTYEDKEHQILESKYVITKDALDYTNKTTVDYTIEVEATDGEYPLSGGKVSDYLPNGLELTDATVTLYTPGAEDDTENEYTAGPTIDIFDELEKTGTITYDIPENDEPVVKAVFNFTVKVQPNEYDALYNGEKKKYENTATFTSPDENDPKTVSDSVKTEIELINIKKDGEISTFDKTRFNWSLDISTSLPYMDYGYIIDSIKADDHEYDFRGGITVTVDKNTTYAIEPENIVEIDYYDAIWDDIRAGDIRAAGIDEHFFDVPHAYYYYVDTDEPNMFADIDGRPFRRDCYMIIPFDGLQGTNGNLKKVKVEYSTKINLHTMSKAQYWTYIEELNKQNAAQYNTEFDNIATLLWKDMTGTDGNGHEPLPEIVEFDKNLENDPAIIVKHAVRYDSETMYAEWRVELDKLAFNADNVVFYDDFGKDCYDPDTISVKMTKTEVEYTLKPGVVLPDAEQPGEGAEESETSGSDISGSDIPGSEAPSEFVYDPRYYDVHETTTEKVLERDIDFFIDIENGRLNVPLDDIEENTSYEFTIKGKLTDPSVLAVQDVNTNVAENDSGIDYVLDGEHHDFSSDAAIAAPNVLIEKSPVGSYSEAECALKWKMVVGKNGLPIENGLVTDTLPEGFVYMDGSLVVNPADVNVTVETANDGNTVYFRLGDELNDVCDRKVTLTYKSLSTQEWRNKHLVYGPENTDPHRVRNTATLTGSIYGCPITDSVGNEGATVIAENEVPVKPIGKKGVYNKEKGTIDWKVELNLARYTVGNTYLVESLSDELELVPSSLKVASTSAANVEETYSVVTCNDMGFKLKFLNKNNNNNYIITFTTLLTGDAAGATIYNKVCLKNDQDYTISESPETDGGYDGTYTPADDSNAHFRPNLCVQKTSINSVEPEAASTYTNSLRLEGARFRLSAYTYTFDDENKVLHIGEPTGYSKEAVTDATGNAYIGNIKTSDPDNDQVIFLLYEVEAPKGYAITCAPKLVFFEKPEGDQLSGTLEITDAPEDITSNEDLILIKYAEESGGWTVLKGYFTDEPLENDFTIQKRQLSWFYSYENGAEKEFAPSGEGVEFSVAQKDAEQLVLRTFKSDENGFVHFRNLDPGEYIVTETKPPYGMVPGWFYFKVSFDPDTVEQWHYEITTDKDSPLKIDDGENGEKFLTNDTQLTDAQVRVVKKVMYEDGNEEEILSGVKLRIVSVAPDAEGGAISGAISRVITTSDNGTAALTGLPVGNYEIYEVNDGIGGYKSGISGIGDTLLYTLNISQVIGENGKPTLKATFATDPNYDHERIAYSEDDDATIYNKPVRGTLTFTKNSISDLIEALNPKPLQGVEFGLYRVIGGKAGKKPVYTVKSTDVENGNVVFENVEFGTYELREIRTVLGFEIDKNFVLTLTPDALTLTDGNRSYAYVDGDAITNRLHQESFKLVKLDEDNKKLSDIEFEVYRRGTTSIKADDDSDYIPMPDASVKTYYPYEKLGVNGVVKTGTAGDIAFDLPYGDYLFVEKAGQLDLRDDAENVAVWLSIGGESPDNDPDTADGAFIVDSKVYSNGTALSFDSAEGCYTVPALDGSGWSSLTGKNADNRFSYNVVNRRRYAYVRMHKVSGDIYYNGDETDTVTAYGSVPLKDKTFAIYHAVPDTLDSDNDGSVIDVKLWEKYISEVKTDKNGNLIVNTSGAYGTKNPLHLWYGDYYIQESGMPSGYTSPKIYFSVNEHTSGDQGFVWIECDGTYKTGADTRTDDENKALYGWDDASGVHSGSAVSYFREDKAPEGGDYVDVLTRCSLDLEKIGDANTALPGAVFELYADVDNGKTLSSKDVKVADFVSDGKGKYTIALPEGATEFPSNSSGIPYIIENDRLLGGYYILVEKTEPNGYLLADNIFINVSKTADKSLSVSMVTKNCGSVSSKTNKTTGGKTVTVTDDIIRRDVTFSKSFASADGEAEYIEHLVFGIFRAAEDGTETPVIRDSAPLTVETGADGLATFTDLTEGEYIVRELLAKSIGKGIANDVYVNERAGWLVKVTSDSTKKKVVVTVDDMLNEDEAQTLADGAAYAVTDERMNGTISLFKYDSFNNAGLAGVEFTLTKHESGGEYVPYGGENNKGVYKTASDGKLVISGLERGMYKLSETKTLPGYYSDNLPTISFTISNGDHVSAINETGAVKVVSSDYAKDNGADTLADDLWFSISKHDKTDANGNTDGSENITASGVQNVRIPAQFKLTKTDKQKDENGKTVYLNNVVFKLTLPDGTKKEFMTGYEYNDVNDANPVYKGDGVLFIKNIDWGTIKIFETKGLPGYKYSTNSYWTATTGPASGKFTALKSLALTNTQNSIKLSKKAAEIDVPLSGAVYSVSVKDKPEECFLFDATDANGLSTLVGKLTQGQTYVMKEETPPTGYKRSDREIIFTVGNNSSITLDKSVTQDEWFSYTADGYVFSFADEPVNGTITFHKQADFSALAGFDGAPVAGAEFVLRRVVNDTELASDKPGYVDLKATSDKDGIVKFENVPFGDYNLYETKAGEGYAALSAPFKCGEVKQSDLLANESGFAKDYATPIENAFTTGSLSILKTEKTEGALNGISFNVYRRGGTVVAADGTGMTAVPDAAVDTYYTYGPCAQLTTDENGKTGAQLPYGDYLLVEQPAGLGLVDDDSTVALLAHVTPDGTTAKLYASATALSTVEGGYKLTDTDAEPWTTVSVKDGAFPIVNERKHVLVDLKKITGNVGETGTTYYYENSPLKGIDFIITERGKSEPLFTLTTGDDGHLHPDEDAETYGGKFIRCGDYVFAEKNKPEISCEFTVPENVKNGAVVWFDYDGKNVGCTILPEGGSGRSFINTIERQTLSVVKTDKDDATIMLEGAEFDLIEKTTGQRVAVLSSDKDGCCTFTDCEALNEDNIPYCVEGKLLSGEYILRETKSPDGWLLAMDTELSIGADGAVTASGEDAVVSDNTVIISDIKLYKDISIVKYYDRGAEKATASSDDLAPDSEKIVNVVFALFNEDGTPVLSGSGKPLTAKTDENGRATFKDIPAGDYVIREDVEKSLAAGAMPDVYIDPDFSAKVTVRANEEMRGSTLLRVKDDGSTVRINDCVTVGEPDMNVNVELLKLASDTGEPLEGTVFRLERLLEGSRPIYISEKIITTGKSGEISFTGLTRGSYRLSEIKTVEGYDLDVKPVITFKIVDEKPGTVLKVEKDAGWFNVISGQKLITEDGIINEPFEEEEEEEPEQPEDPGPEGEKYPPDGKPDGDNGGSVDPSDDGKDDKDPDDDDKDDKKPDDDDKDDKKPDDDDKDDKKPDDDKDDKKPTDDGKDDKDPTDDNGKTLPEEDVVTPDDDDQYVVWKIDSDEDGNHYLDYDASYDYTETETKGQTFQPMTSGGGNASDTGEGNATINNAPNEPSTKDVALYGAGAAVLVISLAVLAYLFIVRRKRAGSDENEDE